MSKLNLLVTVVLLGLTLSACEKEGPGEKAGKEIDKAAKEVGKAMEKAVDSVKDATKSR
jgi:outer membrane PBP1 activator LpoA protein